MTDIYRQEFPNYSQFLAFAKNGKPKYHASRDHAHRETRLSSSHHFDSFHPLPNFESAYNLALKGWSEGTAKVRKLAAPFYNRLSSKINRPEPYFTESGGSIDMARYLDGEPESFLEWRDSEVETDTLSGKIVRIVVNVFITASFRQTDAFNRGAALVALIDLLETAGRRVELLMVCAACGRAHPGIETVIPLKAASEPLDLDILSFALCHVEMVRRLCWSAWECSPVAEQVGAYPDGYYGQHTEIANRYGADIFIQSLDWQAANSEQWLIEQLKQQGVEFSAE